MQIHLAYNNLGYPQRRRMYKLNDHHSLNSNVQLHWQKSLQSDEIKRNKVIEQKKNNGTDKLIQNYNRYVDKEINNRYQLDNFATIVQNDVIMDKNQRGTPLKNKLDDSIKRRSNSQMHANKNENQALDKSLNYQMESIYKKQQPRKSSFNSLQNSGISSQLRSQRAQKNLMNNQSQIYDQMHALSPKFQKQLLLRSALDPIDIYAKYSTLDYQLKNFKPDTLQNYLRVSQKKHIY